MVSGRSQLTRRAKLAHVIRQISPQQHISLTSCAPGSCYPFLPSDRVLALGESAELDVVTSVYGHPIDGACSSIISYCHATAEGGKGEV
jgi:hypothetical protein